MALMKWAPSKEMERLFEEFVDDPFLSGFRRRLPMWKKFREFEGISPAVDMIDKKDEIVVKAEVPGVEKNDINISLTDSTTHYQRRNQEREGNEGRRLLLF